MRRLLHIAPLLALVLAAGADPGDSLPRRAYLGTQMTSVPGSWAEYAGLEPGQGVLLVEVMAGSAAFEAGLRSRDIILEVGDWKIEGQEGAGNIVKAIMRHREGDELPVKFWSKGKIITKTVRLDPLVRETYGSASVHYTAFQVNAAWRRAIATKPRTASVAPAVMYIQDFGCDSIDQPFYSDHRLRQFIEGLGDARYVTYRVEKSAVGDSEGRPCDRVDFEAELEGFQAGLDHLRTLDYVDPDRIVLFGHGVGSLIAAKLAETNKVAGIITFGAVGANIKDYVIGRDFRTMQVVGIAGTRLEEGMDTAVQFGDLFFDERLMPGEIDAKHPELVDYLFQHESELDTFMGVHYKYWHQLADIDVPKLWQGVKVPTLVLYPTSAYHASFAENVKIEEYINQGGTRRAKLVELHGVGNQFDDSPTPGDSFQDESRGYFHPIVIQESIKWLRKVVN